MKKLIAFLVFALTLALAAQALACTKAQPNGSAGNANNPATGFITDIVTNGGPNLTVTYAGTVQSTVSFYSTNVGITGAWHATVGAPVITSLSIKPGTGWNCSFSINGVNNVLNFSGIAIIGSPAFFAGTGGGLTGITGLGVGQERFTTDGINNGASRHTNWTTSSPAGCTFDVQDLGAVGLALMPDESPQSTLWWER